MKFFVDFLSAFRIAIAFAIIPTWWFNLFWLTFILFVLGSLSDLFDGILARKCKVASKLGGVMDHIADKILVANALILLCLMMPEWFIVVPVILMIGRDLYVSGLREFLGTQKIEMPVPKAHFSMGKIKTALQMISLSSFFLAFAINSSIPVTGVNRSVIIFMKVFSQIGFWGLLIALIASLWSATEYTITFSEKIKKIKK